MQDAHFGQGCPPTEAERQPSQVRGNRENGGGDILTCRCG